MLQLTGLESLLAARYLRRLQEGRLRIYLVPALFLVAHLAMRGAQVYLDHSKKGLYSAARMQLESGLRVGQLVTLVGFVLMAFLVWLIRRYTIFSSISTFGLFLGSAALVVVLSVMSGFEQDLKGKILGTHAHMVVTAPDRTFTDYREVLAKVEKVPGVVAATPYLTSEVMIASPSNLSGVIIKGIDPTTVGRVTELAKNTQQGSLDNLLHPEQLRILGSGTAVVPAAPPGTTGALMMLPDSADGGSGDGGGASPAQPTKQSRTANAKSRTASS